MTRFGNMIRSHWSMRFMNYFLTGRASSHKSTKVGFRRIGRPIGGRISSLKMANKLMSCGKGRRNKKLKRIRRRKRNLILSMNCMSLMKEEDSLRCLRIYSSPRIRYRCSLIRFISWSNYAKHFMKRNLDYPKPLFNL